MGQIAADSVDGDAGLPRPLPLLCGDLIRSPEHFWGGRSLYEPSDWDYDAKPDGLPPPARQPGQSFAEFSLQQGSAKRPLDDARKLPERVGILFRFLAEHFQIREEFYDPGVDAAAKSSAADRSNRAIEIFVSYM